MKPSLAIIGSGIAGMGAAYYLRKSFDLKVFEKNDYIGGHTNTVFIEPNSKSLPVDTGFMVFNTETYPNLCALFDELGVESYPTSMSFGVRRDSLNTSFACTNLSSFFAQKRRFLSIRHWRFLFGIKSFFEKAHHFLDESESSNPSLREFVDTHNISNEVVENFLVPMAASIWSTQPEAIMDYPARTLLTFMRNHRMLGYGVQFQWRTVKGGSEHYKQKLLATLPCKVETERPIVGLFRDGAGVLLRDSHGETEKFDYAIVATHADQALALLENPSEKEQNLLGAFSYNRNKVLLHSDESVMPRERAAWASWNFKYSDADKNPHSSIHYWMNNLQQINDDRNYFVSVDYKGKIENTQVHRELVYEHPLYDKRAIDAQSRLGTLNESGPIYYCGSYFRYGFHEDALSSALDVVKSIKRESAVAI